MSAVFFRSARLEYRIPEHDDAPALAAMMNDAEVRRFLDRRVFPVGLNAERRWIDKRQEGAEARSDLVLAFGIAGRDHIAGATGFRQIDWINRSAMWGIVMRPDYWGHGYGAEVARRMILHAFRQLNLNVVRLEVNDLHARAIRCYERVGFVREGCLRQAVFTEGAYRDVVVMSVLRDEWSDEADD